MVILEDRVLEEHTLGKAAVTGSFHVLATKTPRPEFSTQHSCGWGLRGAHFCNADSASSTFFSVSLHHLALFLSY